MKMAEVSLSNIGEALSQIAVNATSFSERLNHPFYKNINPEKLNQTLIDNRLKSWCKAIGGEEKLRKRLHEEGLDFNTVRPLFATANSGENHTLPPWADTLSQFVQGVSNLEGEEKPSIDPENPLPFEDFYFAFILVGRHQLHDRLSPISPLEFLNQEAYETLEHSFLKQLVNLGTETLLFEFNKFRENYSNHQETNPQDSQSRFLYCTFIQNLLGDGGLAFFQHYPVLARLIATATDLWVESTVEFIQHLQGDLSEIESTFRSTESLGKVKAIETSLSNPHHGGRHVLAVTFSSNIKVIYKPKNVGMDVAFNQLLDWCNQKEISLPFKSTKILDRQGYGWIEFIAHQPCQDQAAVQRFYQRAGMLLSLLYVLGAKNCYAENVIAQGEYPVLIDADSLMHPVLKSWNTSENWFETSVLSTGFLSVWKGELESASAQDFSVLGNIFPQQVHASREWKFVNTDNMHLASRSVTLPPGLNVVILEGKTASPKDHIEEIIHGFEEIYQLFVEHRETLWGEEGPLSEFKLLKSRFILRPTIVYGIASQQCLSPQYLRNGLEQSILIEHLVNKLSHSSSQLEGDTNHREIWQVELTSLRQRDVPYFSVLCDSNALEIQQEQSIQHFFKVSSYQRLIAKLNRLDEQDATLQVKLIRFSFYAKSAHLSVKGTALQDNFPTSSPLTSEKFLQKALDIGNSLVAHAIWNADGCNWLALEHMYNANRYQLQPLDDSLYTGRAGVSLFLAALGKVTGDRRFHKVALAALSPFRSSIKRGEVRRELLRSDLGLLGLGGTIYSMVKVSQFLQKPALLEDALKAAKLITPEAVPAELRFALIAADHKLDVMWGVAGIILGLMPLYQETGSQAVLETAIACGNHLLSHRSQTNPRAWITLSSESKIPLTGFSHGAAGIALALLRLYFATGNTVYLEAAEEGIEYERSVFDRTIRNWPDYRSMKQTGQVNFLHAWCHGSSGIGLARLGSLAVIPTEATYSEIDIALDTAQKYGMPIGDVDYLCCGRFGRIELFLLAAERLGHEEWRKTAREQATWVVQRAKENEEYALLPHLPNSVLSPSFYKGSAGIGYELLRLAFPELLPSVLIWE